MVFTVRSRIFLPAAILRVALSPRGVGGTSHMKGVGMLVGNFELNPYKGDRSGSACSLVINTQALAKHKHMKRGLIWQKKQKK